MTKSNNLIKIIFLLCSLFSFSKAYAIATIDITKGNMEPFPIAINDITGYDFESDKLGRKISAVIAEDLEKTGLFRVVSKNAFIETLPTSKSSPVFASWRQINANAVFAGDIKIFMNGGIDAEYKLWDSYAEKQLAGSDTISSSRNNWRKLAHMLADEIYKSLTGEEGYFNTKVAFIAEYGPPLKKSKRLAVMDYDGENVSYLTEGKNLILTPRFSPDASKIIYLSYEQRVPKVFLFDLINRTHKLVGHFHGMSFAPRFSPNGKEAIMSASRNGNSDIYLIDLATLKQTKLTDGTYIDTSPYFSPNGEKVAFSSDRSGNSHIYIMNKDGSDQKRISFGKGSYFTPSWSPRGDYIAFTKIHNGSFHIGVMRTDGTGERILTEGFMVEGPSWSPNGRVIMFTSKDRHTRQKLAKSQIQTIDLTGYHQQVLPIQIEASDPNWSPLLN